MTQTAVQLTRLSKSYRSGGQIVAALTDVTLQIESGERVAITGPSGCGKSTLLHVMGCLEQPTAGTYTFAGRDIGTADETSRARLRLETFGFVFQRFHLIDELSVGENVELPLLYRGIPAPSRRSLVEQSLNRVGLWDRRSERPANLSGGQQQRVAIARAVAGTPRVILADEPTGNLDAAAAATVIDLLFDCHRAIGDAILIIVTHNQDLAARLDRIVELRHGRVASDVSVTPAKTGAPSC